MLNHNELPSDNQNLEQLLGAFAPRSAEIDRDQVMFQAGLRAAHPVEQRSSIWQSRAWPLLATASTLAAVMLSVVAWQRPAERIVYVERPAVEERQVDPTQMATTPQHQETAPGAYASGSPAIDSVISNASYLQERDRVLRDGVDAMTHVSLEGPPQIGRAVPTQRQLLQELPGELRQRSPTVSTEEWWQPWLLSGDRS